MRRPARRILLAGGCSAALALCPAPLAAGDTPAACTLSLTSLLRARIVRVERVHDAYSHGFEIAEIAFADEPGVALVKLNSGERVEAAGQCLWNPRLEASSAEVCGGERHFFSFGPARTPIAEANAMPGNLCASCHKRYGAGDGVFWSKLGLKLDRAPAQTIDGWIARRTCMDGAK